MYQEVEPAKALRPNKPQVPRVRDNNRDGLQRPSANRGAFAHLEVPMQKRRWYKFVRDTVLTSPK